MIRLVHRSYAEIVKLWNDVDDKDLAVSLLEAESAAAFNRALYSPVPIALVGKHGSGIVTCLEQELGIRNRVYSYVQLQAEDTIGLNDAFARAKIVIIDYGDPNADPRTGLLQFVMAVAASSVVTKKFIFVGHSFPADLPENFIRMEMA